ncbi:MAG: hypothetical protein F6K00_31895 [Leptolyngbya sp. SIOISBB]|nr:hypothetical protein [Leptolyngbya sp. SIOISBB]
MEQLTNHQLSAIQQLLGLPEGVRLIFDKIPTETTVQLPIPDCAQVIGSFILAPDNFSIVLSETGLIEALKSDYREQLTSCGWVEKELFPGSYKGFKHAPKVVKNRLSSSLKFCHELEDVELSIEFWSGEVDSSSQVTVVLTLSSDPNTETVKVLNLLPFPPLLDPPDAFRLLISGGTQQEYATSICLETRLEIQTLYVHYKNQFEADGWTLIDENYEDSLVWGRWKMSGLRGQKFSSFLNIVKLGGVIDQYSVLVRVIQEAAK